MRLAVLCLMMLASLTTAATARPRPPANPAPNAAHQPPHAWLFGTWTGLFPVLADMAAQDCHAQPTVVFSKDAISHASLLAANQIQRSIATVRVTATGAEFTLVPEATPTPGFGCTSPDELHVTRKGLNEINFPGCGAFPYPLERCSS